MENKVGMELIFGKRCHHTLFTVEMEYRPQEATGELQSILLLTTGIRPFS